MTETECAYCICTKTEQSPKYITILGNILKLEPDLRWNRHKLEFEIAVVHEKEITPSALQKKKKKNFAIWKSLLKIQFAHWSKSTPKKEITWLDDLTQ